MSIYINKNTKVITQGITGKTGQFHTEKCIEYANGKNCFVAGVNPKKAGEKIFDVPIFASVKEAAQNTAATVSVIYVPPAGAAAAIWEAVEADLDVARAGLGAVERGLAAEYAGGVAQDVQAVRCMIVAAVEDEPVCVHDRCRADVGLVTPEDRARGGAAGTQDAFVEAVQFFPVFSRLTVFLALFLISCVVLRLWWAYSRRLILYLFADRA